MRTAARSAVAGFTILEGAVGLVVLSIGVACALGGLTRFNGMAGAARNASGAYTSLMNQIDLIQSDGPFNPQKTNLDGTPQIPPELALGTQTQTNVPIYQDPNTGVIVAGTMKTTVTDVTSSYTSGSTTFSLPMYKAVVTVSYSYLGHAYSFTMSTIRSSDI